MPRKKITFEDSITELESVIKKLENENITLEEAIKEFEVGVKAISSCRSSLSKAEGKLTELLEGEDGEYIETVLGLSVESIRGGE